MKPWETVIIAVISSGALVKVLDILYDIFSKRGKARRKQLDELAQAVTELKSDLAQSHEDTVAILHDRLHQLYSEYANRDSLTVDERTNIDLLWQRYNARGGNHGASVWYDCICNIPVVPDKDD